MRRMALCAVVAPLIVAMPLSLHAQDAAPAAAPSGKWTATIAQLNVLRGAADLSVSPKSSKESRAKLSLRLVPINRQVAWDIVAGRCGDEG
jgi:hypothetical protein